MRWIGKFVRLLPLCQTGHQSSGTTSGFGVDRVRSFSVLSRLQSGGTESHVTGTGTPLWQRHPTVGSLVVDGKEGHLLVYCVSLSRLFQGTIWDDRRSRFTPGRETPFVPSSNARGTKVSCRTTHPTVDWNNLPSTEERFYRCNCSETFGKAFVLPEEVPSRHSRNDPYFLNWRRWKWTRRRIGYFPCVLLSSFFYWIKVVSQ